MAATFGRVFLLGENKKSCVSGCVELGCHGPAPRMVNAGPVRPSERLRRLCRTTCLLSPASAS